MGTTAIKRRHRSELPIENLSEKRPGVVEPVGKLAGRTTGFLRRGRSGVPGEMKLCRPTLGVIKLGHHHRYSRHNWRTR